MNDGDAVTATATAANGSTSEFSQCVVADFGGGTAPDGSGTIDRAGTAFPTGLDRQHGDLHVHRGRRRDGPAAC